MSAGNTPNPSNGAATASTATGGNAGAGAADHHDELALVDRQRKVVDGHTAGKGLADMLERDHPGGVLR